MSLLPNDLASGSTAVIPMLTEAGPTQPYFAPASGGGGGSGISTFNQLFVSTIGTTNLGNVDLTILAGGANLVFDAPINGQLLDLQFQVSTVIANGGNAPSISCFDLGGTYLMSIGAPAGVGMTTSISTLNVSSINGALPGGAVPTNLEVSTLRVSEGAPNTGIKMKYSDGTSSFGIVANDGTVFNQIKPSLVYGNNLGTVVSLGADIVAGGLGLTGTGGSLTSQTAGYISGDGAGNIGISSLNVSSINSASPGSLAVGGTAKFSTIQASSIGLQGFSVPLFQNGRFTMPMASSNVVETDIVFSDTTWGAWACYDGAVNSAVSSIGTQVLSRSTFALYAQGGLGVSWQVLGN